MKTTTTEVATPTTPPPAVAPAETTSTSTSGSTQSKESPAQSSPSPTTKEEDTSQTPSTPSSDESVLAEAVKPEETPAAAATEEEYELELSENSPLTEADLDSIVKIAEEKNLTKDQATEFLKNVEKARLDGANIAQAASKAESIKQKNELLADPLFSTPEKKMESLQKINTVISKFGGEHRAEIVKLLQGPAGNNKALANMLISIADAGKEDTIVPPKRGGDAPVSEANSHLKTLYPAFFE
jgi:hypothetical protein